MADESLSSVGVGVSSFVTEPDKNLSLVSGGTTTIKKFKMRAQDRGAPPPGYVTWISTGAADFAGAGYSGGTPTPVGPMVPGSVVLVDEWEE